MPSEINSAYGPLAHGVGAPGTAGSGLDTEEDCPGPSPAFRAPPAKELPADVLVPGLPDLDDVVRRIAPQQTTVLLSGDTGTGKTRLAHLIHDLSPRRGEPFLVIDCGALSESLIESEMFGHVKGAFTGAERDRQGKFAAAGQGTLLLDEVNSLPLPLQSKLLRVVDERIFEPVGANKPQAVRARLLAASNVELEKEVAEGRFRSDLYYRLNVVTLYLPGLRDRRSVVGPLVRQMLTAFAARNRPDVRGINPQALHALEEYHWPGNLRELRNVVERAVALCEGPEVQVKDLPKAVTAAPLRQRLAGPQPAGTTGEQQRTLAEAVADAEVRRIVDALVKHGNNRLRAAAELGISRMGLYKKLHRYGLIQD